MPNKPKTKKKPWQEDRVPFGRRSVNNYDFYNSTAWRKKSKRHKELNPFCVECEKEGVIAAVEFTDHIIRIEDGGDKFSDENLQSLCGYHHNSKSGKEAHRKG